MCWGITNCCYFLSLRTGSLCIAVYKAVVMLICTIVAPVEAAKYRQEFDSYDEDQLRIATVVSRALVAATVPCVLLLAFHLLLLGAVLQNRPKILKVWVIVNAILEVLICSSMFMAKWNTLYSFVVLLNFALNVYFLRVVWFYKESLLVKNRKPMDEEDVEAEEPVNIT